MKLARSVFLIGGIWGIVVLAPFYLRFEAIRRETPPAVTHPEFYYGFLSVAFVWQLAFLLIAADPIRFRPMMGVAMVEKVGYVVSIAFLYAQAKSPGAISRSVPLQISFSDRCFSWHSCRLEM